MCRIMWFCAVGWYGGVLKVWTDRLSVWGGGGWS
jgi:hypothetical protein